MIYVNYCNFIATYVAAGSNIWRRKNICLIGLAPLLAPVNLPAAHLRIHIKEHDPTVTLQVTEPEVSICSPVELIHALTLTHIDERQISSSQASHTL